MNRSRLRPALFSVAIHSAVLLILLLGVRDDASGPSRQTIIYAEFLQSDDRSPATDESPSEAPNDESSDPRRNLDEPQSLEPIIAEARADPAPSPVEEAATDTRSQESPAAPIEPNEDLLEPTASALAARVPQQPLPIEEPHAEPVQPISRATPMPARQHSMLETRFASWTGRIAAEPSEPNTVWKHDGQEYTATFRHLPADDDMSMERLLVEVSTEENGRRISTEMRMKRLAFSSFAQFVDRWDPEVRIHDDEVDGRFHSNSEIHLLSNRDAKPIFHGRVTTASRGINTDATGRVDRERMFLGGLEIGVKTIVLPKHFVPFPGDTSIDSDQIQRFAEDARITFYANGTYGWRYIDSNEPEQQRRISDDAYYLVADDDKVLHVKGSVKGKVLIYSPERIIIEDDLTYAREPNGPGSGDDYLGIVSDKSVEIAGPDSTGPGDLLINASIYAKRQFVVRNYRSAESGTLFIYGSLIAGSVSATEPRFATKIQFDPRLENLRAPRFPLSDRYELEAWDGEWRAAEPTSN